MLTTESLNCTLSVLLSTREETGGAGAKTGTFLLSPTLALALDVSYGYTNGSPKHKCGELYKGPMIGISPILSRSVFNDLKRIAEDNDIPYQTEVMGGLTRTAADQITGTKGGISTGLISIPIKYMHSAVETAALEDFENTVRLVAEFVKGAVNNA
jgi:endoglucanase